jgi:signal transduction histidine kinase
MTAKDVKIKELQSELGKYREELNHLIKERSEYLRVSAHQMKSPIATILFSVDTLLGDYAGPLKISNR